MKTSFRAGLLSVLFLFAAAAGAQGNIAVFGVKAGINFSGHANTSSKTKTGYNIGVTADFRLSDYIYLLTGLEYTIKGSKDNDFVAEGPDRYGQFYTDHYYITNEKPAYLQMPLHVGYLWAINRDFHLMFHAGPFAAYGTGGKNHQKWIYMDDPKKNDKKTIDYFGPGISKYDWGLGGGVNVEYDRYVLGLGYDRGLRNITPEYNNGKGRTRNMYITLGYLF
jgi:hypothetical protein